MNDISRSHVETQSRWKQNFPLVVVICLYATILLNVTGFPWTMSPPGGGNIFGWPWEYLSSPLTSSQKTEAVKFRRHHGKPQFGLTPVWIGSVSKTEKFRLKALLGNVGFCLLLTVLLEAIALSYRGLRMGTHGCSVLHLTLLGITLLWITFALRSGFVHTYYVYHSRYLQTTKWLVLWVYIVPFGIRGIFVCFQGEDQTSESNSGRHSPEK